MNSSGSLGAFTPRDKLDSLTLIMPAVDPDDVEHSSCTIKPGQLSVSPTSLEDSSLDEDDETDWSSGSIKGGMSSSELAKASSLSSRGGIISMLITSESNGSIRSSNPRSLSKLKDSQSPSDSLEELPCLSIRLGIDASDSMDISSSSS